MAERLLGDLHSVWIAWETQRRSTELAKRVATDAYFFDFRSPFRYPRSIHHTLRVLFRESPDVVFVQNPSMILAGLACLWGRVSKTAVVVDRHSTFMLSRPPRRTPRGLLFRLLHRFTLRSADVTIVTNDHLAGLTRSFGGTPYVLPDPLPELASSSTKDLGNAFNVVMVSSFADDEPTREVLEAMRGLAGQGITLFVTGDPSKGRNLGEIPGNVRFTGFLPGEEYDRLLLSSDAVMVLTKHEYVMLCGCYEAVSAGKPLITSSKGVLRNYFKSALFVENDPESISEGLISARDNATDLEARTVQFRDEIGEVWEKEFRGLGELVLQKAKSPSFPGTGVVESGSSEGEVPS